MIGRTPHEPPRKGARSRAEIPIEILQNLNAGTIETKTLSEGLALDFATLMRTGVPQAGEHAARAMEALAGLGYVARLEGAAGILMQYLKPAQIRKLATHPSDTVRGWAAYALGALAGTERGVEAALDAVRGLAADSHFGVREWAWMAVRSFVVEKPQRAIAHLTPWTKEPEASLRRFASEATRPRGVWCRMIPDLVKDPEPGLAILEPLRSDDALYVRLSVANWINDASKSRPDWAREVTARWLQESPTPETKAIVTRGLRTLEKKKNRG